ncbi:MAG: lipopolysaccharide export system permease protein [Glaciecola sp.]|jgi:lipopolysaccharide export system permease protein
MKRRHLPFMGRMDRYVLGHFVGSYATALFLLLGLFLIMDMASNLDDYLEVGPDGTAPSTTLLAKYYLLKLPFLFLEVAPFITLLAGMFTVNRLLKKNEVTPLLSAGVSVHRLLVPIFFCGFVLAGMMFFLREAAVAQLADKRDFALYQLEERKPERVLEDVLIHDLSGATAFVKRLFPDADPIRAEDLSVVVYNGDITVHTKAKEAIWDENTNLWRLRGGMRTVVADKRESTSIEVLVGFDLTPELALTYRRSKVPLDLSFSEVQELMSREPEDSAFNTLWHYLLTFPLANVVLLLVGLPVLFQYERGKGTERMALGGLFCIFYFAIDFVFRSLGLGGGLSPILAGWLPILIVGSLGIALTDSIRT